MPSADVSSGIVLFRRKTGELEVLLVHPGGPFWRHRDLGVWSIPKGEPLPGEDGETTARREFAEETGAHPPDGLEPPSRGSLLPSERPLRSGSPSSRHSLG